MGDCHERVLEPAAAHLINFAQLLPAHTMFANMKGPLFPSISANIGSGSGSIIREPLGALCALCALCAAPLPHLVLCTPCT
eukprot:m.144698 g.144698  ORF g.144698 m.144698 type:complete len:81 (-) comp10069_c0_seq1:361-603(-)